MIFIYLLLLFMIGPTVLMILQKLKLFDFNELNNLEKISLEMICGLLFFVIYMFIIGILNIKYSFYMFIPIIANAFFQLFYITYKAIKSMKKKNWKRKYNVKVDSIIIIVLAICIGIWIAYFIAQGLSTILQFSDEYAVWALNAKNIFLGRRMNLFTNTGLEIYPNFLPLLYGGFYIFVNNICENSIKIFSAVFLLISVIGIIGLSQKKKMNTKYILLIVLITLILGTPLNQICISAYGDIAFMATYTLGMLYLFEWLVGERKKEYLLISIVNIMIYSFIKTEGIYLICFNIFILFICYFFHKTLKIKKINFKTIMVYGASTFLLPIAWKIYSIVEHFPSRVILGKTDSLINFQYTESLFTNMSTQFFTTLPFVIILFLFLIGLYFNFRNLKDCDKKIVILGVLTIVCNVGFLIISYLVMFGAEAITAASFIRYFTRIYLIFVFITVLVISPFFYQAKKLFEKNVINN